MDASEPGCCASDHPTRLLTVDTWRSAVHHAALRSAFADAYAALDAGCEPLTVAEALLGEFDEWVVR